MNDQPYGHASKHTKMERIRFPEVSSYLKQSIQTHFPEADTNQTQILRLLSENYFHRSQEGTLDAFPDLKVQSAEAKRDEFHGFFHVQLRHL